MKKILLYGLAALVAASCVYPFTPDESFIPDEELVVDGDIVIGDFSTFHLRGLMPLLTTPSSEPRFSGTGWIEDDAGIIYPSESMSTSVKFDTRSAPADRRYRLHLDVRREGETRSYSTPWLDVFPAPVIEKLGSYADETNVFITVSLSSPVESGRYYCWDFEETWEFESDFYPNYTVDPRNGYAYEDLMVWTRDWCWRSDRSRQTSFATTEELTENRIVDHHFYSFSRRDSRLDRRYSINVKAYSISPEGYTFLRTLRENSDNTGSLFSPSPSELCGNISCDTDPDEKVLGFVEAVASASKRLYLDSLYAIRGGDLFAGLVIVKDEEKEQYYNMGYRPVDYYNINGEFGMAWAPERCIDCIAAGGTQVRPEWWEDN